MGELGSGMGELGSGMGELGSGMGELGSGMVELGSGMDELGRRMGDLGSGMGQLGRGMDELGSGMNELGSGMGKSGSVMVDLGSGMGDLVTVLMNWPPVFHLQWLGHVPHVRQHLPTTIVWNSPMRELIGSVMVSSLLLPTFGTLSLPLYFRLPLTFLPSKGRSITTLGARWHDFFYYTFLDVFY